LHRGRLGLLGSDGLELGHRIAHECGPLRMVAGFGSGLSFVSYEAARERVQSGFRDETLELPQHLAPVGRLQTRCSTAGVSGKRGGRVAAQEFPELRGWFRAGTGPKDRHARLVAHGV